MSDANKVKIEIETVATGSGGASAVKELEALNAAASRAGKSQGEAAKGTESLTEAVSELGARNNAAKDAVEGLDAASRGGAGALFGVAKAIRSIVEIASISSPLGILVTALSALIGVGLLLKEKFFDPAEEGFKKTGEEAGKAAERITAVEKAELKFEKQKKALDELKDEFAQATAKADALFKSEERLSDAKTALKIGQIDLNEQQALGKAGGDENLKKQISAEAEAQRTVVRLEADKQKKAAEATKTQSDLAALEEEKKKEAQKAAEIAKDLNATIAKADEMRKKAALGGVKSDQERELAELAAARNELTQKKARQEELNRVISQPTLKEQLSGDRDRAKLEAGKNADDISKLQDQIDEKARRESSLRETIGTPNETFTGEKEKIDAEVKQRKAEREKAPKDDEAKNLLDLAERRSVAIDDLIKSVPASATAKQKLQDFNAAEKKRQDELDTQIQVKRKESQAVGIEAQTIDVTGRANLTKQRVGVGEENDRRLAANRAAQQKEDERQSKIKEAEDRQLRNFSNTPEGQKAAKDLADLQSQPTSAAVPLLSVDALKQKNTVGVPKGATSTRPSGGTITFDGVTKRVGTPAERTGPGTINGEPLKPIASGNSIARTEDAPQKDSGKSAAEAIDKGAAAIQKVGSEVPKPIAPESLSAPIEQLGQLLQQVGQGNLNAVAKCGEAIKNVQEQTKQLLAQVNQLAQQVANTRQ